MNKYFAISVIYFTEDISRALILQIMTKKENLMVSFCVIHFQNLRVLLYIAVFGSVWTK